MVTAGIKIDLFISFERVDVMENEKWFRCEDTHTVAIFSVDNVESDQLVCIPVKPIFKPRWKESVGKSSPYVDHKRLFGHNNVIIGEAEAMKVP